MLSIIYYSLLLPSHSLYVCLPVSLARAPQSPEALRCSRTRRTPRPRRPAPLLHTQERLPLPRSTIGSTGSKYFIVKYYIIC